MPEAAVRLLAAHAPTQVDPRASAALRAPDDSSLPALLPHRHPQLATVPVAHSHTHKWAPGSTLLVIRGLPPHTEHRGPVLTTKPSSERAPTALSRSGNPALPLSVNLSFHRCQKICFPKAQKGPALLTVPDHGRSPASLLKIKNTRFPTEGKKTVTTIQWHQKACLRRYTEAQHSPLFLTAGEPLPPCRKVPSHLSCPRANPRSSTQWQSTTLQVLGG
jgi:hypothetical protein